MKAKKYFFYVSDPKLKKILDELKRQKIFPEVIQGVLNNGLERQLKQRAKNIDNLLDSIKKKPQTTPDKPKTDKGQTKPKPKTDKGQTKPKPKTN